MIGGVTSRELPHLPGAPHLHVNRPKDYIWALKLFLVVCGKGS